jgi:hypothetical protein
MQMVMFIKETGKMIKPMDKDFITILMEPDMKENGLKINNMDMELKLGLMVLNISEIIIWVENMEKENFYGLMEALMRESFRITIFMEMVLTAGLMVENL